MLVFVSNLSGFYMTQRICDRCKSDMERISKRGFSKLLGRFTEVRRYKCENMMCKSEKLTFSELKQPALVKFILPFIVTLGLSILLILGLVIFANSSPNQTPPQCPTINKN
jgi:hypothetical protein